MRAPALHALRRVIVKLGHSRGAGVSSARGGATLLLVLISFVGILDLPFNSVIRTLLDVQASCLVGEDKLVFTALVPLLLALHASIPRTFLLATLMTIAPRINMCFAMRSASVRAAFGAPLRGVVKGGGLVTHYFPFVLGTRFDRRRTANLDQTSHLAHAAFAPSPASGSP